MRIRQFWARFNRQSGISLIELLIGVTISAMLVGGVTMAIVQVLTVNAGSNSRMVAIKQVENAIDTLRRDVIVAQELTPNADGHIMMLKWVTWEFNAEDTETHIVTYDLNTASPDRELTRTESVNGTDTSRVLARHIESISVDSYEEGKLRLTITSRLENLRSATETRTFDILQRPAP